MKGGAAALATRFNVLEHLDYLRLRLLRALVAYGLASVAAYFLTPAAMDRLIGEDAPLQGLVFLSPGEAFFARVKLALAIGLLLGLPFILYQLWALFAPAMSRRQKWLSLWILLPGAYGLFLAGVLFAFFAVLPIALRFFLSFGGESLQQEISVGNYVSFLIGFVLPFGVIFELPVVILALARIGVIRGEALRRNRKYAVFAIFVVAGALTPADALSQILMAAPLLLLYEVSILLCRLVGPRRSLEAGEAGQAGDGRNGATGTGSEGAGE